MDLGKNCEDCSDMIGLGAINLEASENIWNHLFWSE